MWFKKKNDSPPCVTCAHYMTREYLYPYCVFVECSLTPDKDGVYFMECRKARKTKYCNYEKKEK